MCSLKDGAGEERDRAGRGLGSTVRRRAGCFAEAFVLHFQLRIHTTEDVSALVKTVPERGVWLVCSCGLNAQALRYALASPEGGLRECSVAGSSRVYAAPPVTGDGEPSGKIAWPCPKRVRASHPEGRSGWRLEIAGRIGKTLQSESYERYQELKAVRLQRGKAVWGAHVAL